MKGIILSGGSGTRLRPLTRVTSKQLLAVYDKPMVYFPLYTLLRADIKDILIIVAPEHSGDYLNLLGSGSQFGARFTYDVQDAPLGLAHGLSLAQTFADGQAVTLILGDNIFENDFRREIKDFQGGAKIFAKQVHDPERFGVVEFDKDMKVISIEEKPAQPKSQYAQTGLYIYEGGVFDKIKTLKPSARGELEITDLNNLYLQEGKLMAAVVNGEWIDAGTFESLYKATALARKISLEHSVVAHSTVKREVGPFSGVNASFRSGVSSASSTATNQSAYAPAAVVTTSVMTQTMPQPSSSSSPLNESTARLASTLTAAHFIQPKKKVKILITGGAGFMGSNMIRYLLQDNADVEIINIDKLTYAGNLKNLLDIERDPRYTFVKGDIADGPLMDELFNRYRFDCVINYAAETHVDRSIIDPQAFLYTDIIGTYNLLEAVKKYAVERMIQISTDEVYGEAHVGEFYEHSPFQPNSPYSATKAGADHLCRAYLRTYGVPVIVTHSCNFYGPYQYPEKVIPLFITNLLEDKKVPLYGRGEQTREWIYTQDHCRAIDLIRVKGRIGDVYNIGTGARKRNIELTNLLLQALGKDDSYVEYVTDRPGHDFRYAVNWTKVREELGWQPEENFENRLSETVKWYQDNASWWREIKSGAYLEYYKKQYGARSAF